MRAMRHRPHAGARAWLPIARQPRIGVRDRIHFRMMDFLGMA